MSLSNQTMKTTQNTTKKKKTFYPKNIYFLIFLLIHPKLIEIQISIMKIQNQNFANNRARLRT